MPARQLIFLGVVGLLSLLAALFTGPMLTDALLGSEESTEAPVQVAPPPAEEAAAHPSAQP